MTNNTTPRPKIINFIDDIFVQNSCIGSCVTRTWTCGDLKVVNSLTVGSIGGTLCQLPWPLCTRECLEWKRIDCGLLLILLLCVVVKNLLHAFCNETNKCLKPFPYWWHLSTCSCLYLHSSHVKHLLSLTYNNTC